MTRRTFAIAALSVAACLAPLGAEERINADINTKIRQEEKDHSQVMRTLHFFTDVYGPRVTGSPNLKAAGEWAIKTMESWGMTNGHLEPWDFGHPGWVNERLTAHIVAPVKDALVAEVLAWTPGTNGVIAAQAYQLSLPDRPTPAELTAFLDKLSSSVQSGYLFSGRPLTIADQRPLEIDDQRPLTIADMRDYAERKYRHIVTASY